MILGVVIQCNTMPSSTTPERSNVGMLASASHLTFLPIWRMKQSMWCVAMHSKGVSNVDNVSSLQIIIYSQIVIIHIIAGVTAVVTTTWMILQHPLPWAGPSIPPKMVHPTRRRRANIQRQGRGAYNLHNDECELLETDRRPNAGSQYWPHTIHRGQQKIRCQCYWQGVGANEGRERGHTIPQIIRVAPPQVT